MSGSDDWLIYRGTGMPHDGINRLPPPPPWRPSSAPEEFIEPPEERDFTRRGQVYLADTEQVELVNAALYLRRPLLVTGPPGSGKSSLAYSVAYELGLGPVLRWPVSSRSTLQDALYRYDAIARLQDASLASRLSSDRGLGAVGRYIRLGPLGTALLPWRRPRVVLIDELDKSDLDLPGDVLNVLEEGEFEIPELVRQANQERQAQVSVDGGSWATIADGRVRCSAFPFVVVTSNGEREFPPTFLRHCIQLQIPSPDESQIVRIVQAQLGQELASDAQQIIHRFLERRQYGELATDQLLNALYLMGYGPHGPGERARLVDLLLRELEQESY